MEALRYINLTISIIGIILTVFWMRRNKAYRWIIVAPLTVLVNIALFYTVRIMAVDVPTTALNTWSATISTQIAILYVFGVLIFWKADKTP